MSLAIFVALGLLAAPAAEPAQRVEYFGARALRRLYAENPLRGDALFLGKRVRVLGRVSLIRSERPGSGVVELGGDAVGNPIVRCELDRKHLGGAAKLKEGFLVVVSGVGARSRERMLRVASCAVETMFEEMPVRIARSAEKCILDRMPGRAKEPGGAAFAKRVREDLVEQGGALSCSAAPVHSLVICDIGGDATEEQLGPDCGEPEIRALRNALLVPDDDDGGGARTRTEAGEEVAEPEPDQPDESALHRALRETIERRAKSVRH